MLRTLDEAAFDLSRSLLSVVDAVPEVGTARLRVLMEGRGSLRGLDEAAVAAVVAHRSVLGEIRDQALGWMVADEVDGVLSYVAARRQPRRVA